MKQSEPRRESCGVWRTVPDCVSEIVEAGRCSTDGVPVAAPCLGADTGLLGSADTRRAAEWTAVMHLPAPQGTVGRRACLLWATRAQPAQPLLACQADKHPARMRERYRDRLEACDRVWDCLREGRRKGQRVMECASPRRICARLDLPRSRRRRAQSTRAGAPAATLGRLPCCVCALHRLAL